MKIYVNSKLTDPKLIGWNNHLNYGQMQRFQPNQIFNYVMMFSTEEFLSEFSEMFAEQAAVFKEIDEDEGGEPTDFAVFNYGSLKTALSHPRALYQCFEEFMMTDKVLPFYWPDGGGGYIINCLDRLYVTKGGQRVMLEGRGWSGRAGKIPSDEWMDS